MATLIGNPTFSPTQIGGCALWLDASDRSTLFQDSGGTIPITTYGQSIGLWKDKSGNGKNGSVSGTITYNSFQNSSAVKFTSGASNTYIRGSLTNNTNTLTAFVIAQQQANTPNGTVILGVGVVGQSLFYDVRYAAIFNYLAGYQLRTYRNGTYPGFVTPNFVPYIGTQLFDGTNNTLTINGGTQTIAGGSTGNFGYTSYQIGTGFLSENTSSYIGNIGEIIVYHSSLTTAQRAQIEGYLAWKWKLQSSLPTTHPYYYNEALANLTLTRPVANPYNANNINLFSPTVFSGCVLWLDAADSSTIGLSGGTNIISVRDKSSNAYLFSNATGFTYNVTKFNGTYVSFYSPSIGANTLGSNVSANFSQPLTVFIVGSKLTIGNGYIFDGVNNVNRISYYFTNGSMYAGSQIQSSSNILNGVNWVVSAIYNSANSFGYFNGIQYTSGSVGTGNTSTGLLLGNRYSLDQSWNGHISEIIFYNNILTTSQRQQVEGYLAWKWGLQSSLPANHPYYNKQVLPAISTLPYPFASPTLQNYTLSPRSFSGLALWLDAADSSTVGLSGGTNIISIRDKSSNAFLFSNATGFTYNVTKFNGSYPSFYNLTPSLSNNLGSNTSLSFSQPLTVFTVANKIGFLPTYIFDSPISVARIAILSSSLFAGNQIGSISINGSNFIFSSLFNTTNSIGYKDGTQYVAGNVGINNLISGLLLANRYTLNNSWDGHICEIIFYNRVLSTSQRQQIEGYLAWKWGLQKSLPSSHPYVLFPP